MAHNYPEYPPETRDRIVEMYQAGTKLGAITKETGASRPTIYWILQSRGIKPSRTAAATLTSDVIRLRTALDEAIMAADLLAEQMQASSEETPLPTAVRLLSQAKQTAKDLSEPHD